MYPLFLSYMIRLLQVAFLTEQLQILKSGSTSLRERNDVVKLQVLRRSAVHTPSFVSSIDRIYYLSWDRRSLGLFSEEFSAIYQFLGNQLLKVSLSLPFLEFGCDGCLLCFLCSSLTFFYCCFFLFSFAYYGIHTRSEGRNNRIGGIRSTRKRNYFSHSDAKIVERRSPTIYSDFNRIFIRIVNGVKRPTRDYSCFAIKRRSKSQYLFPIFSVLPGAYFFKRYRSAIRSISRYSEKFSLPFSFLSFCSFLFLYLFLPLQFYFLKSFLLCF